MTETTDPKRGVSVWVQVVIWVFVVALLLLVAVTLNKRQQGTVQPARQGRCDQHLGFVVQTL